MSNKETLRARKHHDLLGFLVYVGLGGGACLDAHRGLVGSGVLELDESCDGKEAQRENGRHSKTANDAGIGAPIPLGIVARREAGDDEHKDGHDKRREDDVHLGTGAQEHDEVLERKHDGRGPHECVGAAAKSQDIGEMGRDCRNDDDETGNECGEGLAGENGSL